MSRVAARVGFKDFHDQAFEGFSFLALRQDIDLVFGGFAALEEILEAEKGVGCEPLRDDVEAPVFVDRRVCFLLALRDTPWTLFFRTIHWIDLPDVYAIPDHAESLSSRLGARVIGAVAADEAARLVIFEAGEKVKDLGDFWEQDPWLEQLCRAEELYLPAAFISAEPKALHLDSELHAQVVRVDRIELAVVRRRRGINPFTGEELWA